MNIIIEKSRSTLTWIAGLASKMFATWFHWIIYDSDQNFWFASYIVNWLINMFRSSLRSDLSSFEAKYSSTSSSKCNDWDDAGANGHCLFVVSSIILIRSAVLIMYRFADSFWPAVSVHVNLNLKKSGFVKRYFYLCFSLIFF
jgi:hypothetical protein